jgi:hypothetical protein
MYRRRKAGTRRKPKHMPIRPIIKTIEFESI